MAAWFDGTEDAYRSGGAVGPRMPSPVTRRATSSRASGRDAAWGPAHAAFAAFTGAFGRGDVDAIMALMTDDCVFEATGPAPDGIRHEGAADVRSVWESLFTGTGSPAFTAEESFVAGDRGVLRWRFDWVGARRLARPRARRRRRAPARRQGLREALVRQGLTAAGTPTGPTGSRAWMEP